MIGPEFGYGMAQDFGLRTEGLEVLHNLNGMERFVLSTLEELALNPENPIIFVVAGSSTTGKDCVEDQLREAVEYNEGFQAWLEGMGIGRASVYSINFPSSILAAQANGDFPRPIVDGSPKIAMVPPQNADEFKAVIDVVKEAVEYGVYGLTNPRFLILQLTPTAQLLPEGLEVVRDRGESVVDWMVKNPDLKPLIRFVCITNEGRTPESRESDLELRSKTADLTPENVIDELKKAGIVVHFKNVQQVEDDRAAGIQEEYSEAQREWLVKVFPQLRAPGKTARRMLQDLQNSLESLKDKGLIEEMSEKAYYTHLIKGWGLEDQSLLASNPEMNGEKHYYFEGNIEDNNLVALMYREVREVLQPPLS